MLYEEFAPTGAAADHVESYWRFTSCVQDNAPTEHSIVPDGLVSVSAALFGEQVVAVSVVGPATEAHVVPLLQGVRHAGFRLRPGSAKALLGIDPIAIAGTIVPMEVLCAKHLPWAEAAMSRAFASDASAHLDAAIARLAHHADPVDPVAAAASDRLMASDGRVSISSLASGSGLSERQFRARFTVAAGLSPKAFARVRRHRAAWISLASGDADSLAEASQVAGYADQPHFSRETQRAFNTSPGSVRQYIGTIGHKFR